MCTDPPPRTPRLWRKRQIYLIGFSWITRERLSRSRSDHIHFVELNFAHLLIYNLYIFVEAFGSYSPTKKITKINAAPIILILHRPHPNWRCVTCSSIICSNFSPIDPLFAELFKVRALGHFEKKSQTLGSHNSWTARWNSTKFGRFVHKHEFCHRTNFERNPWNR